MDILDDMGVSKLSAKVFLKWTTPLITTMQVNVLVNEKFPMNYQCCDLAVILLAFIILQKTPWDQQIHERRSPNPIFTVRRNQLGLSIFLVLCGTQRRDLSCKLRGSEVKASSQDLQSSSPKKFPQIFLAHWSFSQLCHPYKQSTQCTLVGMGKFGDAGNPN